nr:hypothetical protein [Tanacetum cinerariifolium]
MSDERHIQMEGTSDGRDVRMDGTSGWKARPDGRDVRMDESDVRMKATTRWMGHPDGRDAWMKGTIGGYRYVLGHAPRCSLWSVVITENTEINDRAIDMLFDATTTRLRSLTSKITNNRYLPSATTHAEPLTSAFDYEANRCPGDGPSASYIDPSVAKKKIAREVWESLKTRFVGADRVQKARHVQMEGTSGWKARPDERDVRMEKTPE